MGNKPEKNCLTFEFLSCKRKNPWWKCNRCFICGAGAGRVAKTKTVSKSPGMHVQRVAAGDPDCRVLPAVKSAAFKPNYQFPTWGSNRPASMPAIPSTHQSANLPGETVSKLYKFAWEPVGLANLLCDLHFFVALFFMFRCSSADSLLTAANCAKLASDCGKFQSGTGL